MRLTLRTLLCYLDDILDPTDSHDLGKKIEESKFATDLVHRIRTVSRQPQMGAPRVEGKGLGLDANTVSEYLDNTLPAEMVPEYERICLESDMHMAETAASHQILTLVLGEPVEVDTDLRQRMYAIGAMSEAERQSLTENQTVDQGTTAVPAPKLAHVQGAVDAAVRESESVSSNGAGRATQPARKPRPKPEVPDYMKLGRKHHPWPVLATVLVTFVVAAVGLRLIGPFDGSHPLYQIIAGAPPQEIAQGDISIDANLPAKASLAQPGEILLPNGEKKARNGPLTSAPAKTPVRPAVGNLAPLPEDTVGGSSIPSAVDFPADTTVRGPGEEATGELPEAKTGRGAKQVDPVDAPLPDSGPDLAGPARPNDGKTTAAETRPNGALPKDAAAGSQVARVEPPVVAPGVVAPGVVDPLLEKPPGEVSENRVASYLSQDEILARYQPEAKEWRRLSVRAAVSSGSRLLALPAFRPKLLLVTGIQLELAGGTMIGLAPQATDGPPGLVLETGKILLWTVEKSGTAVDLQFGTRVGRLTFSNADAAVAVTGYNYLPPGSHPETDTALPVAQLFATSGQAVWTEPTAKPIVLQKGRIVNLLGEQPAAMVAITSLPDWVTGKNVSDIERRAANTLAGEISGERPLGLSLNEMAEDRRTEVKGMAVRSLGSLEQYEGLVSLLADEFQKSSWASAYDSLRSAISHNKESAAKVRMAFERLRHEDGKKMYRLLWGYSPEQLRDNTSGSIAAELVAMLEHPALDVRVLAFENLRRITGTTHLYRPELPEVRRRSAMVAWRERLKGGQVAYKTLPSPLGELMPSGTPAAGLPIGLPPVSVPPGAFTPPATASPALTPIQSDPPPELPPLFNSEPGRSLPLK